MGWAEALVLALLALLLVIVVLLYRRLTSVVGAAPVTPTADEVATAARESASPPPVSPAPVSPEPESAQPASGEPRPFNSSPRSDLRAEATEQLRAQLETERHDLLTRADEVENARQELKSDRRELRQLRRQLEEREQRLSGREQRFEVDLQTLGAQRAELDQRAASDELRGQQLAQREAELEDERARLAGLDSATARAEVLSKAEHDARLEASALAREIERQAKERADQTARRIIVTSIQRLASEQTAESVVTAVELPSEEMKGRIIGREGRNIRAFEQITGVNVLIDDTPEVVLLSAFDPVRRETARLTLDELVADGRIHPHRIEEVHARSERMITERVLRAGEDALLEVGITDLHPELVPILGSLRYRTSYGQNVLQHLIECAHLAQMMASELGLEPTLATRGAFLHDIGKALTHASEGSHALVGADLARKYGEHPDVVHAIEAHHNEVEPTTVEALLTQAADAISGSRPAARRESLEAYVQRLEKLESLVLDHEGVERVFAMQAGREVRVMVLPDQVDDAAAQLLAKQIAKQITEELTFPGQIRVTVVRESRATEIAH